MAKRATQADRATGRNESTSSAAPGDGSGPPIEKDVLESTETNAYSAESVQMPQRSVFKSELDGGVNQTRPSIDPNTLRLGNFLPGFEPQFDPAIEESVVALSEVLPDAWEGTYGPSATATEAVQETLIGRDDRQRVMNTQAYPFNMICSLVITAKTGKRYVGTGWLAGPKTIFTAGHCVFMHREGGFVSRIDVYPARNASIKPFSLKCIDMVTTSGWQTMRSDIWDFAAIRVNEPSNLYFGFKSFGDSDLSSMKINVFGYPADKDSGTMWGQGNAISRVYPQQIKYQVDTYGGQSGAPAFTMIDGRAIAVGIHNYGDASGNLATRINAAVKQQLVDWYKKFET